MGTLVTFSQKRGWERTWVPRASEEMWIQQFASEGTLAVRLADYKRWGGFTPPLRGFGGYVSLRKTPRQRTNYRRWHAPE
jgi:hypothetical protein